MKYFTAIDLQLYEAIRNNFIKKTQEISTFGIDRFKNFFWFEENGEPKIWSKYSDQDIEKSYKGIRSDMINIFDNLKYLKTFKHPLKCIN